MQKHSEESIVNSKNTQQLFFGEEDNNNLASISHCLYILVKQNNVFLHLVEYETNKVLLIKSSESYKLRMSKRKIKDSLKIMLRLFRSDMKKKIKSTNSYLKTLMIKITAPSRYRQSLLEFGDTFDFRKQKKVLLNIDPRKSFNGCRPRKKKRKKQRSLRFLRPLMVKRGG